MDKDILSEEKKHLEEVIDKVADAERSLIQAMDALGSSNLEHLEDLRNNPETSGDDFMVFVQQLHEKNAAFNVKDKIKRLEELIHSQKEPYFARLDLADTGKQTAEKLYIGKFGYTEENYPVIVDWRSKVASVYYRYRYPQNNVEYIAPEGRIVKDMHLKRTFEIDNGELIKYYNNDIQFDEDSLIVDKIGQRTGGVLEDIVETIQESQLDIIESDPRQICIVQGSVGSGKSTVAIHKLSHVFFNYPEIITPERSILIAKNGVLVGYLATLFPKLGIFDVNYKTVRELVVNMVFREKLQVEVDLDEQNNLSAFNLHKVKELEKDLDVTHRKYEEKIENLLEDETFGTLGSYVYDYTQSVVENIDELIADLKEELGFQTEKFKDNPKSTKSWIFQENIKNLRKFISRLQKLRQSLSQDDIKKIYKKWDIDVNRPLDYLHTLIALYIHSQVYGIKKTQKYQYCVVDEGQDISPLEYLVLSKIVLNGRFCILGDLNQSFSDEGLTAWDEISAVVKEANEAKTFELDTNYRSTKPIIEFANALLSPYTDKYLPKSINRVGPEPVRKHIHSFDDAVADLEAELSSDLKDLNKSIGIICFDDRYFDPADKIFRKLERELDVPEEKLIKLETDTRISYIPKGVYLSRFEDCKGLEFAKVYVLGLNLDSIENFAQAKKAFVAVTRAMNELVVYG